MLEERQVQIHREAPLKVVDAVEVNRLGWLHY